MQTTPWTDNVADTPVGRLAWALHSQYRWDYPPHLAVEALGKEVADRYNLTPAISFDDAVRVMEELGIPVEIERMTKGAHGRWEGDVAVGEFTIYVSDRDAETRQTLTVFHEFYELLRAHLHAFECAPFPDGMEKNHFVPERMARRFSAAIGLPRAYVADFLHEDGLDVPLLVELSGRSPACVVRRLRELISGRKLREGEEPHPDDAPLLGYEIPFLAVTCALRAGLVMTDNPQFLCIEHVRSHQFSIRRNRQNSRDYLLPRKKEVWTLGTLVERVMSAGMPVFAPVVTGFDLFGMRNLCALAIPEWENERVAAVAIYATPSDFLHLWEPVLERLECEEMEPVVGLVGSPIKTRKAKPRRGDLKDVWEGRNKRGEEIVVELFSPIRRKPAEKEDQDEQDEERTYQVGLLYLEDQGLLVLPVRYQPAPTASGEPVEIDTEEEVTVPAR